MEQKDNSLANYPDKILAPTWIKIPGDAYWETLAREVVLREVDLEDFQNGLFIFGFKMLSMGEGERMVLRDNAGFEENIDLFDPHFDPTKPRGIVSSPKLITMFMDTSRIESASQFAVSRQELQELGSRMLSAGLHVARETRENGKRVMHYKDGKGEELNFDLGRAALKKRLEKFSQQQ